MIEFSVVLGRKLITSLEETADWRLEIETESQIVPTGAKDLESRRRKMGGDKK